MSVRRNPARLQDTAARRIAVVWIALAECYLAAIGYILGSMVNTSGAVTGIAFISGVLPILLFIDFILRFALQPLPIQNIKPYLLLPLPRRTYYGVFVCMIALSKYNLASLPLYIVYGLLTILPQNGVAIYVSFIITVGLLTLANSLWYTIVNALTTSNIVWWSIPAVIYATICIPMATSKGIDFNAFCDFYASVGTWCLCHICITILAIIVISLLLFIISQQVLCLLTKHELQNESSHSKIVIANRHLFFINSYIWLEAMAIFRNKSLRSSFTKSIFMLAAIALLLWFIPLDGNEGFKNFWLIYCFGIFAEMLLIKIMGNEGNYIDLIMTSEKGLLNILRGKYCFFIALLLLPALAFLPLTAKGYVSLTEIISYTLFTAGPIYFLYFQLAVYNKQTISQNSKLTGKNTYNNRMLQALFLVIVLALSWGIVSFVNGMYGRTSAEIFMDLSGVAFIATYRLWTKSIYRRIMKRKYKNIMTYYATRE